MKRVEGVLLEAVESGKHAQECESGSMVTGCVRGHTVSWHVATNRLATSTATVF